MATILCRPPSGRRGELALAKAAEFAQLREEFNATRGGDPMSHQKSPVSKGLGSVRLVTEQPLS
jgi:hypothetical protein